MYTLGCSQNYENYTLDTAVSFMTSIVKLGLNGQMLFLL